MGLTMAGEASSPSRSRLPRPIRTLLIFVSALVFTDVSPYWIRAVQGTLILITVIADILRRRRMAGA